MYSLIGIGYDCSPAGALRSMGLRREAYPFDWIQTDSVGIRQCIADDFLHFHCDLRLMEHGHRMIDYYGFQYPHDYPVEDVNMDETEEKAGEGVFTEEVSRPILSNWARYYETVKEKYARRIQRFRLALAHSAPVILLCRHPVHDAKEILTSFRQFYKRNDIYMVNSAEDSHVEDGFITVWTERDGIWNSPDIWKEGLDALIEGITPLR